MSDSWSNDTAATAADQLIKKAGPPRPSGKSKKGCPALLLIIWDAVKRFVDQQGLSQAAALAFYALLSLLPIILLMLILAGIIWGNTAAVQNFLSKQIHELAPWAESYLQMVVNDPEGSIAGLGWISLIFIIWTSGLFFAQLQRSLITPWNKRKGYKSALWRLFFPWTIGPALAIASGGAMLVMNIAVYLPTEWLPSIIRPKLISWLSSAVLILVMYKLFLPRRCVPFYFLLILSALLSGAELALSLIFAMLIVKNPQYTLVYGSLAALVLFLIWIYYSMCILIFGGYFLESWVNFKKTCK